MKTWSERRRVGGRRGRQTRTQSSRALAVDEVGEWLVEGEVEACVLVVSAGEVLPHVLKVLLHLRVRGGAEEHDLAASLEREVLATAHAFATHVAEVRRWSPDTAQKFRDAASLADRHYRLGAVPIATYVELQSSYLDAIEALLDTQAEALAAGLKLRQLTGLDFNAVTVAPAASAP